jgi:DNA-binding response OmpR family regulator
VTTILIVEDDKTLNRLYVEVFGLEGFETLQATSCQQVMDYLQQVTPAVILLDLFLPDGNGLSIVSHVREHPKLWLTPIIAVSGAQGDETQAAALAINFLRKPVSILDLVDCVKRLIAHPSRRALS